MSLPGLLIEYLITGVVALLSGWWLFAEANPRDALYFHELEAAHIAIAAPVAYLIGMFIDYVGKYLAEGTDYVVTRAAKWLRTFRGLSENTATDTPRPRLMHKAEIFARAPEVGKQYEMRKSRDRIARGLFANVVVVSLGGLLGSKALPISFGIWLLSSGVACVSTFVIWRRCAHLTLRYKEKASVALALIAAETQAGKATAGAPVVVGDGGIVGAGATAQIPLGTTPSAG